MNILSNILKIDYNKYIINDKSIKLKIIDLYFTDKYYRNNINFELSILIKYNNIYYLQMNRNNELKNVIQYIFSYDTQVKIILEYNNKHLFIYNSSDFLNSKKYEKHNYFCKKTYIFNTNLKHIKKLYYYDDNENICDIIYFINNYIYYRKKYNKKYNLSIYKKNAKEELIKY